MRKELRPYFGHKWQTITRPAVLTRAGFECERCGMPDRPMGTRSSLDIAHLSLAPGQQGHDEISNLAALCRKDHRAHNYDSWAEKFKQYLKIQRDKRVAAKDAERPILALLHNFMQLGQAAQATVDRGLYGDESLGYQGYPELLSPEERGEPTP